MTVFAEEKTYEKFPLWIPALSLLHLLSIYILGAYILYQLGIAFFILYLLLCIWLELGVLKKSCVNCCYYGGICGLGRGWLCSKLFYRGSVEKFAQRQIAFKDIAPDFLIFLFPVVGGIVYLMRDFKWLILILIVILIALSMFGSALMRGLLLCKYCKQRLIGCPAEQFFGKKEKIKAGEHDSDR